MDVLQQLPVSARLAFSWIAGSVVDIHRHLHGVANGNVYFTIFVDKLGPGYDALCFQSCVDCHPVAVDIDHGAGYDRSDFHVEVFQALFEKLCETLGYCFTH